jgi:hypothetical protein
MGSLLTSEALSNPTGWGRARARSDRHRGCLRIRRWTKLPGFDPELATARRRHERELERAKQREQKRRDHNARRRLARQHPARYRELYNPAMRPELRREQQPAAESEPARGRLMRPIRLP